MENSELYGRNSIDHSPTVEEAAFLSDRLDEYNAEQTRRDDFQPIRLVMRDGSNAVIAGLKGLTGWDWLYVQTLWVHEQHRSNGIGSRLLNAAESEAKKRGCLGACLSSYSFQSPEFYQRHGYRSFGKIDDYPMGQTMFFLSKRF